MDKHEYQPTPYGTCRAADAIPDECVKICGKSAADPIHQPAEQQGEHVSEATKEETNVDKHEYEAICDQQECHGMHKVCQLPTGEWAICGKAASDPIHQPTTLAQPNLPEGWLRDAINAPAKTLEEVAAGAYNPYAQPAVSAPAEAQTFKKRPVFIEAVRWSGSNHHQIEQFCPNVRYSNEGKRTPILDTPDGFHAASIGDWIIKDVKGEYRLCNPDVFSATYDHVPSPAPDSRPEAAVPDDLKGLWAQAQLDSVKPWHWMQITPSRMVTLIERIARLEAENARQERRVAAITKVADSYFTTKTSVEDENRSLKRWKAEAMAAMAESEGWRRKFDQEALKMGGWGSHYLKSAYEIALRCQRAEAENAALKQPSNIVAELLNSPERIAAQLAYTQQLARDLGRREEEVENLKAEIARKNELETAQQIAKTEQIREARRQGFEEAREAAIREIVQFVGFQTPSLATTIRSLQPQAAASKPPATPAH